MRRIIAIVLVCLMTSFSLIGCGGKKTGNQTGKKTTLNVSVFNGGYGTEFLEQISAAFEAEYPYVDVVIETTDLFAEIKQQIAAGRYVADVIISTTSFIQNGAKGEVLDITDVYESYPYGEDGVKTIQEKLGAASDANVFEGKYYQIPIHSGHTGIVYNKVYLDAIYGEGNYTLPVTSKQFTDMCNDIKSKGAWPMIYTNSVDAEYATFLRDAWTVQYMGYDAYKDYFNLNYKDAQGNLKAAETAEELHSSIRKARTSSFTSMAEVMSSSMGYAPPSASSMSYDQAQAYFVGFTSQPDVKTINGHKGAAFMVNGDWVYNEVEKYGVEVELDIRFMRTPVNSAIIDNLDTVTTEERLVECLTYIDTVIDGVEGKRPEYLSEEDYNRLYEARRMVWTTHAQSVATIPATCNDADLAKDFLRFMASDASALAYSNALDGVKSIFSEEVYAESSQNRFTESINKSFSNPLRVTNLSTPYVVYGGLRLYYNTYIQQNLYKCDNVSDTARTLLSETEDYFSKKWTSIMEAYQE